MVTPDVDWDRLTASVLDQGPDHLVLDKPVGLAVQGERAGDDISTLARRAGVWVMPAHRIDKPVSGAVLFARNLAAHRHYTNQFRLGRAAKSYLAVVPAGDLPARGTIELSLRPGRKGTVRVAGARADITFDPGSATWHLPPAHTDPQATPAVTRYQTIATSGSHQLLALTPVTGRRHQIRVHLAWIGFAVVGDPLFQRVSPTRLMLHSWRLAVDNIVPQGARQSWEAPPDGTFRSLLAGWGLPPDPVTPGAGQPPP